jgi:hypothetical protein
MSIEKIIESIPGKSEAERARMRRNAEARIGTGSALQQGEAAQLLEVLDAAEPTPADADHAALVPRERQKRVSLAFRDRPPTDTERKVLLALLANPGSTSNTLSGQCGWSGMTWHNRFGTMCKERMAYLWAPPVAPDRGEPFWSGMLADYEAEGSTFTMRPDVVAGLAEAGIKALRPA